MMPLKIIAEYKLYREGKLIDSDRKEIMISDRGETEEENEL